MFKALGLTPSTGKQNKPTTTKENYQSLERKSSLSVKMVFFKFQLS
jgi:hypothetical protein